MITTQQPAIAVTILANELVYQWILDLALVTYSRPHDDTFVIDRVRSSSLKDNELEEMKRLISSNCDIDECTLNSSVFFKITKHDDALGLEAQIIEVNGVTCNN